MIDETTPTICKSVRIAVDFFSDAASRAPSSAPRPLGVGSVGRAPCVVADETRVWRWTAASGLTARGEGGEGAGGGGLADLGAMPELSRLTWYGCHPRRSRGFRGACGGAAMDRNSAAQRHVGAGHIAVQRRWSQDCRPLLELTIPNPAGQAVQGLPWGRVLQELRNRRASPGHPHPWPCAITSIHTS